MKKKLNTKEKNLVRRYLVWCYKTTKEDLDRVDRYFTQFIVDENLLKTLKSQKDFKSKKSDPAYTKMIKDFEDYKNKKMTSAQLKKYSSIKTKKLKPQYQYLKNRFVAIEKAIVEFLGRKELSQIEKSYEEEMTSRILTAREHS